MRERGMFFKSRSRICLNNLDAIHKTVSLSKYLYEYIQIYLAKHISNITIT